jgi:cytochrome c-type biogenesis protein CcmE
LFKKKRFLIGGIIILIAVVYLAVTGFQSSASYYYTVSETVAKGAEVYGQSLRINGTVASEITSDIKTLTYEFTIAEGGSSLPVVYKGTPPDNFGPDTDVVVGGTMDASGVLQADSITTKCPSKYVAEN